MSEQNNSQNPQDNNQAAALVGNDPNKPVVGEATQALANKRSKTTVLNHRDADDPNAPRIIENEEEPVTR